MIVEKVKERLALIARMRVGGESLDPVFSERDVRSLVGVIDQIKAENEALRKDAERYRWLKLQRSKAWIEAAKVPMNHTDAHIDAAMSKDKQSG